ncbi:MAG: cytidylate kinase-like family protein [Deltaproteobacteria bacterium]|nr:cytidylate kinase-like family protein [Deltaproteobacteria bacterium]MBW2497609.1 cytidylate kinase-like family protein [Deltaproteobacteria bacterium]
MLITISRQFMTGGSDVAVLVAEALGWTVIDRAFIDAVAERSGYSTEDVEALEESVPTFMERFAQSSALSLPEFLISAPRALEGPAAATLAHVTRGVVEELADREKVVIVGRAADAVLARERDAIHVRLVASREWRVQQTMQRMGLDEEQAGITVDEHDLNRERYHREFFGRDWNDPVNYHLVLNTELLGFEGAADLIVARARALGW